MLDKKVIKVFKKEGFIKAWQRGHKSLRKPQHDLGIGDAVRCVGQDYLGNKYYEDLKGEYHLNRRWVEYSDHFDTWAPYTEMIPPGWNGWLSQTYDDIPGESNFVNHFYIKEWTTNYKIWDRSLIYHSPGCINPMNGTGRQDFIDQNLRRIRELWEVPEEDEIIGFEGKKMLHDKFKPIADPMEEY